jgi:hypothetical protein
MHQLAAHRRMLEEKALDRVTHEKGGLEEDGPRARAYFVVSAWMYGQRVKSRGEQCFDQRLLPRVILLLPWGWRFPSGLLQVHQERPYSCSDLGWMRVEPDAERRGFASGCRLDAGK